MFRFFYAILLVFCMGPWLYGSPVKAGSKTSSPKASSKTKAGIKVDKTGPTESVSVPAGSATNDDGDKGHWRVSGGFSLSYKLRYRDYTNSETDQDVWGSLGADISYRKKHEDVLRFVLRGIGQVDMDNPQEVLYQSLADTYSNQNRFELYTAFVDAKLPVGGDNLKAHLKVGRQHRWDLMGIHFDGLDFYANIGRRLKVDFFGGVPLRYFESPRDGNWIFGTALGYKLTKKLRLGLEFVHLRDRTSAGGQKARGLGINKRTFEDDFVAIKARFFASRSLTFWGKYSFINDRPRKGELHVRGGLPRHGMYWGGSLIWQSAVISDYSTEFSYYYPVLIKTQPYVFIQLFGLANLGKHLIGRVQMDIRQVAEDKNEGQFNHSFQRFFISATSPNLLIKGLEVSATLSYWLDSNNDNIFTSDGEIAYNLNKKWRMAVGTRFYLYKYRLNRGDERSRTRSVYGQIVWKFSKRTSARASYEIERDDLATTSTFFTSIRFIF